MRQRRSIRALWLALVVVAVAACGGGGSSPTSPGASVVEIEFGSFTLVNQARDTNHVVPMLGNDAQLNAIARAYSELMRDEQFFSHTSPSGEDLKDRLKAAGYSFGVAGENLAKVSNAGDPAAYAHSLLMEQEGHRENILSSKFGRLGVGVATEGSTVWITQIFTDS